MPKDNNKPETAALPVVENATDSVVIKQTFKQDQYRALIQAAKDFGCSSEQELVRFICGAWLKQNRYPR